MKPCKYARELLVEIVSQCTSIRQVLCRLGVAPYGGNYGVLRRAIARHDIDTSHFLGRAWKRGVTATPRKRLDVYLTNRAPIQSYKLKRRLLRQGILQGVCTGCDLTQWLGHEIPLELDHINGNNQDNRLENLRLLCPNCHALTPTYRSKRRAIMKASGERDS